MSTRMVAMRTAVAHPMPVANGVPLTAIGACEEVPPCCVTLISACACRHVAGPANLRVPYLANRLAPAKADHIGALAAARGVRQYAQLLEGPSRSRAKVCKRLRGRERFFPKNVRRGLLSQVCNKPISPRLSNSRDISWLCDSG